LVRGIRFRPAVRAGGERHITVLFADAAGSMDLQERLDA
jgi:class 3 adenylate cyclase